MLLFHGDSFSHFKDYPPASQTRLKPSPRLKCKSEPFQLKETCTDLKIYHCLYFVSRCTPVMCLRHVYKNVLNFLIDLWPNPGLVQALSVKLGPVFSSFKHNPHNMHKGMEHNKLSQCKHSQCLKNKINNPGLVI